MKSEFEEAYWEENFSEPETMDGIGNANDHVKYIQATLDLESINVSSIVDLGFGLGYMFKKLLKAYIPYKACGVEMSKLAFDKVKAKKLKPVESTKITLYNESLQDWCKRADNPRFRFDLGVCMSVLQYIPDDDLDFVLEVISKRVKYLYLTVPTNVELDKHKNEQNFHDRFALRRSREFYYQKISKHFTIIGTRILESKYYFNEQSTLFTDLFYRY